MRRSTVARELSGIDRPNLMISGMATPTVWLSPRKLDTRTSFDGRAIVVKLLVAVPPLPSFAVPLTVTVYVLPYARAPAGRNVVPWRSSVPSTSLPDESLTSTVVFAGSSVEYLISVEATTSLAPAAGCVTATVLCARL